GRPVPGRRPRRAYCAGRTIRERVDAMSQHPLRYMPNLIPLLHPMVDEGMRSYQKRLSNSIDMSAAGTRKRLMRAPPEQLTDLVAVGDVGFTVEGEHGDETQVIAEHLRDAVHRQAAAEDGERAGDEREALHAALVAVEDATDRLVFAAISAA